MLCGSTTASIDPQWAWAKYQPGPEMPWNLRRIGHLYRRAAFGATWSELNQALAQGPKRTIDGLVNGAAGQESFSQRWKKMRGHIERGGNIVSAQAWWLYGMLQSPNPLREKLTLFWHNHFATSDAKVANARFMLKQNETLREHALGSFADMLQAVSKDPAMMIWLDTNLNKKGSANENYARELMELFSLGIGNYTEEDVREAARAFTGWEYTGVDGEFQVNTAEHDDGEKTVLGRTGHWKGEDVVRICLDQEVAPYFILGKLFRFFISQTVMPGKELLAPLAARFQENQFDIRDIVSVMIRSNLFFADESYRSCVKSPTDFGVGVVRALEGTVSTSALALALDGLGQRLFFPPTVKGWDGGTTWLNSTTLILRQNLALAITSTEDDRFGRRCDPVKLIDKYDQTEDNEIIDLFLRLFLQEDVAIGTREKLIEYMARQRNAKYPVFWTKEDVRAQRIRAVCHLVLTQPEFQLS